MTSYTKCRKSLKSNRRCRGLAVVSVLLCLAVIGLVFTYLIQTNSLVRQSYRIRGQKEQVSKLKNEKQLIEMEIAAWHSPAKLEEIVGSLGMVEIEGVVYLDSKEKAITKK